MTKARVSIKRNDTVVVIAGKEKGKRGKVLVVLPEKERVIVERVNFVKRHQRPTQKVKQGGIIEREGSLHISNVMLLCGKCDKPTRTSVQVLADGRRARVCRKCNEIVDKA
ncbi:MAG: 50S ribosomal protein L24 [Candidatus Rokubacteria bacterium]|nr:50S ribosomal protein L24 [Candidatus Rokubacteria bacterium]